MSAMPAGSAGPSEPAWSAGSGSVTGQLSTSVRAEADHAVMTVTGEIDLATVPELRTAMSELVRAGHYRLLLDLSGVTFCDSTGLGVMIGVRREIRSADPEGYLRIVCGGPVLRALQVTGLTQILDVRPCAVERRDPFARP